MARERRDKVRIGNGPGSEVSRSACEAGKRSIGLQAVVVGVVSKDVLKENDWLLLFVML